MRACVLVKESQELGLWVVESGSFSLLHGVVESGWFSLLHVLFLESGRKFGS